MGGEGNAAGYVIAPRYWAWLGSRRARAVLLWLVALGVGAYFLVDAFSWHESPPTPTEHHRADGNGGHTQIDFGGQWVMGRMLYLGHGRELYHRQRQWEVVRAGFPVEDESPTSRAESILPSSRRSPGVSPDMDHDANNMMLWFMGKDPPAWKTVGGAVAAPLARDLLGNPLQGLALHKAAADAVTPEIVEEVNRPAIGGPLYPPVHALLYAPLGAFDRPQRAYRVMQIFAALMVLLSALGVKVISGGRIPWSVATIALFFFPGTRGGLDLGQNPTISLTIGVWGWALAVRGYWAAGGAVWGLFAFKPVWGLALFVVPLLMRRWRFCIAMVVSGAALGLATLPLVGLQSWFDWLAVGQKAARLYNVDENWILLSRDLQSVPRRILHDFSLPRDERDTPLARTLAWALWGAVFATMVLVYLRYGDRRRATGVGAAFLLLGAVLTCYRFMYYDMLLAAVGFAALLAEPARFFRTRVFDLDSVPDSPHLPASRELPVAAPTRSPLGSRLLGYVNSFPLTILVCLMFYEHAISGWDLRATFIFGYFSRVTTGEGGQTGLAHPRVEFDTGDTYPWETALVFAAWCWCAWRLVRGEERQTREGAKGIPPPT